MSRAAPRLYVTGALAALQRLTLPPDRGHYLSTVLRAQPGMAVSLFNAEHGEWQATITGITKKAVTVEIVGQSRPPQRESPRQLIFAPIKRANLEWLVEKAVELGVTRLTPVLTERTQVRALNAERLEAIAMEAAEQCERLSVPAIAPPLPLPQFLARWPADHILHAALERADAPSLAGMPHASAILIGPEGGFSAGEQALLHKQAFVKPVSLGPRILRAETAGIAALAVLALRDA